MSVIEGDSSVSRSAAPRAQLAFETIRATFEHEAHTELAFRQAADAARLEGRERAQAQRLSLRRRAAPRHVDAALERLVDRPLREIDPPVLAGLRLGLYELLFADGTPDHAAVDQAVELVKRAGAPHASGFVNAVLRRVGREREALVEALLRDDSTPESAAIKHSAPLWLAADVVARARPRGRPLPARRLQRAPGGRLPRQHPAHRPPSPSSRASATPA